MRFLIYLSIFISILMTEAIAQTSQSDKFLGQEVIIDSYRPELEPGKVFSGNDTAVSKQLEALMIRGEEDANAITEELEAYGLDLLAPPIMVEYSRRLAMLNDPSWRYYSELSNLRMMYDARACKDRSAGQFRTVIMMQYHNAADKYGDYGTRGTEDDQSSKERFDVLRELIDSGAPFESKASAWWICSHGMSNMSAAMQGRGLTLDEWWVGEEQMAATRIEAENAINGLLAEHGK